MIEQKDNDELTAAYLAGCHDTRKAYEQRLAEAEAKIPKWIPVSEALPPYFESVLAIRENCTGRPYYATMYRDNNWCDIVSTESIDVTHWMPLPELPVNESGEE